MYIFFKSRYYTPLTASVYAYGLFDKQWEGHKLRVLRQNPFHVLKTKAIILNHLFWDLIPEIRNSVLIRFEKIF